MNPTFLNPIPEGIVAGLVHLCAEPSRFRVAAREDFARNHGTRDDEITQWFRERIPANAATLELIERAKQQIRERGGDPDELLRQAGF